MYKIQLNGLEQLGDIEKKEVNSIVEKLCNKKITKHQIFNVCSNRPILIKSLVKFIKKFK